MKPAVTPCRSCEAPVIWVVTKAGKAMPVDAEPDPEGQWLLTERGDGFTLEPFEQPTLGEQPARYTSHFATCPHADKWRKQ